MKDIIFLFQSEKDANRFYLYLLAEKFKGKAFINGNQVIISNHDFLSETNLVDLIYPFVIDLYVPKIAKLVLKQRYYYDDGEIDQIIPYVLSISTVSKTLHTDLSFSLYEKLIYYMYDQQDQPMIDMEEMFDVLFRNEESWLEIVGFGIEEWQFELTFQERMNDMRQYVLHKKAKYPAISIYIEDSIAFFDTEGNRIREENLEKIRELSDDPPFEEYNHSYLVSTLVSIAPDRIDVYASNDHMHTLYWLMNIFQEKMNLFPKKQFPYEVK